MGLPAALKAHSKSDLKLASLHYRRALDQKDFKDILFQNYGALLRSEGNLAESEKIYKQGLQLFPKHEGIRRNYANLIQATKPFESLEIHLNVLAEKVYVIYPSDLDQSYYKPILEILSDLSLFSWLYSVCLYLLRIVDPNACLLVFLYKSILCNSNVVLANDQKQKLHNLVENALAELPVIQQAEYKFALSWVLLGSSEFKEADQILRQGRELLLTIKNMTNDEKIHAQSLNDINSWNMGCVLLSNQDFDNGWQYFEYGLRAAAKTPQKWQRALPKPFSYTEIALWRGESLTSKRLLLLEEQAVGDVMQFLTLLPQLLEEASHIGILISDRLLSIYTRTYNEYIKSGKLAIWSCKDIAAKKLDVSSYDYQSPLGSICLHRFRQVSHYGNTFKLQILPEYRDTYSTALDNSMKQLVVGISWRGGGVSERIREKSINPESFSTIFSGLSHIKVVDLQYGDVHSTLNHWHGNGFQVHHQSDVNPLKDLDKWLALVDSCDAVVSVANTTIHGAGCLNKPTMCLLSLNPDWRWFKDSHVERSYWYPSVGIARQSSNGTWDAAFSKVRHWLINDAPLPTGLISSVQIP